MKRSVLAIGFWVGTLSLVQFELSACQDTEPTRAFRSGTLAMSLTGVSASGIQYRLSNGAFEITGALERTVSTDSAPEAESIQLELPAGDYQIRLVDGWSLERRTAAGYAMVQAVLISDNPVAFAIVARHTTNVRYRFETAGSVVELEQGRLDIGIDVDEVDDAGSDAEPGLILYTALDSAMDVARPTVGPSGVLEGGSFVAGKRGQAYHTSVGDQLSFPVGVLPRDRGSVEFWARLTGYVATDTIPWSSGPCFFAVLSAEVAPYSGYALQLGGNDGWGGAGLSAWGGNGNAATHCWYEAPTYGAAIGEVAAWHHYALSWDVDGVPGTSFHLQIFLDGQPVASPLLCGENHDPSVFPVYATGTLALVLNPNAGLSMDEFKVWNYAKTDFASSLE